MSETRAPEAGHDDTAHGDGSNCSRRTVRNHIRSEIRVDIEKMGVSLKCDPSHARLPQLTTPYRSSHRRLKLTALDGGTRIAYICSDETHTSMLQ